MFQIRKSEDRGAFQNEWLKSKHSFSFGDYYDPDFMGFGPLRVINEDWIQPGKGFPTHGHRDMEILTFIISGELEHQDSMGNAEKIHPGEIQKMSAGRGVRHSEYNSSQASETHLLQIWVEPLSQGGDPSYSQMKMPNNQGLTLIASGFGEDNVVPVLQKLRLYRLKYDADSGFSASSFKFPFDKDKKYWVQVVIGTLWIGAFCVNKGDALGISDEDQELGWKSDAKVEALIFEFN